MGYACPVCGMPQVDAGHLANHLAFTALTGGDAHGAWLDEQVPGWGDLGETGLAEEVVSHAEVVDVDDAFEADDVAGPATNREWGPAPDRVRRLATNLDEEAASIVDEAREYTRRMAGGDERTGTGGAGDAGDGAEHDGGGDGCADNRCEEGAGDSDDEPAERGGAGSTAGAPDAVPDETE